METLQEWLLGLLASNPKFAFFLMLVGILRVTIVPFQELVRSIVRATPTKKDDEFVEELFSSKAWNLFVSTVEWLSSIKIKIKKRNRTSYV